MGLYFWRILMEQKNLFFKNFLKDFLRFLKNKIILFIVALTLFCLILIWILWLWKIRNFGQIYSPLFTGQIFGSLSLYSLPIFSSIVFLINLILAKEAFFKQRLASFFLLGSAFFVQILTLILIRFYLIQGL